jgi:subtilisin family serine protease
MIQSMKSPTFLPPTNRVQAGTSKNVQESPVESLATDLAEINFLGSPVSAKALTMLASTSADAAALEGTLGDHVPGEVIVRTKPGEFSLQGQSDIAKDFGATILQEFETNSQGIFKSDEGQFLHLKLPAGVTTEEAMAALAKDPRVQFAAPNNVYPLPETTDEPGGFSAQNAATPNDLHKDLYGLHNDGQTGGKVDADIDAPEAWTIHTGRNQAQGGPLIAVIDTGIDLNHPDLVANLWTNPGEIAGDGIDNDGNGVIDDVHGYNAADNNGNPQDTQGHGTHVAGTIGAVGNNGIGVVGVNQNANLMAVKIFGDGGATAAGIIRGIQYASKMGARVANNSWGGGGPNEGIKEAFAQSPTLHMLSAGNNGTDNDPNPRFPGDYDLPNFVRVAATDHNDNLASFSNYAKLTVELGAPGVKTLSTIPGGGYGAKSGTSMATPHVTGAAALIASYYPELSNAELKERLMSGVEQVPSLQNKTITGGRLNVHNSIKPRSEEQA